MDCCFSRTMGVCFLLLISNFSIFAQDIEKNIGFVIEGNPIFSTQCAGTSVPSLTEEWGIELKNMSSVEHSTVVDKKAFLIAKDKANTFQEIGTILQEKSINTASTISTEVHKPHLLRDFRGNIRGTSVPMDNTVAISHNGFIVSSINTNVIFAKLDGSVTFTKTLGDFFKILGLGTRMYDPRVIYDQEERRFIFMCLNGSDPQTTHLCIAFSNTEDPNGSWNYYKIRGNPAGDFNWFDYPNIAVSKEDYYVAGLMRNVDGDWQYSVLYQIGKKNGFEGKSIDWKYYNDIKNADGQPAFNLVPTPIFDSELIGPGMYFVSNEALGGSKYNFYATTGGVSPETQIISYQSIGLTTGLAPDARQKNSNKRLNTFDSRIWSAMYHDGYIYLGGHVSTVSGDVGLLFGKMNVTNYQFIGTVLQVDKVDFGFPSFAPFGQNDGHQEILVNYIVSGPERFPSQEARICRIVGDDFIWSEPTVIKEGSAPFNVLTGNRERWGDYTTTSPRWNGKYHEVLTTGCFGEPGGYSTWLAQFVKEEDTNKPKGDFVANKTTTPRQSEIVFTDITKDEVISRQWYFPGAKISTSEDKTPTVLYEQDGIYDVTLIIKTLLGFDTITKNAYIYIQDNEVAPVANFEYDRDTVFVGDFVNFTNKSSSNSITYKWIFQNGTPVNSVEKNPRIQYVRAGNSLVSLTVANVVGTNTKSIIQGVFVKNRTVPKANFSVSKNIIAAGESVLFTDLTEGGPTTWNWNFPGGSPATSTEQNPSVVYNKEGVYSVTLNATNSLGEDVITLEDYISVGVVSNKEVTQNSYLNIFPNPSMGDKVTVRFNVEKSDFYHIRLTAIDGSFHKTIYQDRIKFGENELTFNSNMLTVGTYLITLENHGKCVATNKLVILK